MISARRGPMPGTASRSGSDILASLPASLRTARVAPCRREWRSDSWRIGARGGEFLAAVLPLSLPILGARRAGFGKRGGRARGGDHQRRAAGLNAAMRAAQLARDQLAHARQAIGGRGIGGEKLLGEPHRAERQADRLLDVLVLGESKLATSSAEVESSTRPPAPGSAPVTPR